MVKEESLGIYVAEKPKWKRREELEDIIIEDICI